MDIQRIIDDIQQLEEMFEAPDIRPAECKRHVGCESAARRNARAQPVVSVVAALRGLPAEVSLQ